MVLGQIGGIAHGHLGDGRSRQASSLEGIISGHEDSVAVRPAAVSGEQHIWYECAVCAACNPPPPYTPGTCSSKERDALSTHVHEQGPSQGSLDAAEVCTVDQGLEQLELVLVHCAAVGQDHCSGLCVRSKAAS